MRSSTLFLLITVALAFFAADLSAQTKQTLRSTISGQVTIKGKPAPGIVVGMRAADGLMLNMFEVLPKAITDQDGNFRITNVSPGTYTIRPAAPAFILTSPLDPSGKSVVVGEAETIDNIDFALVRGGVITGKVTDADQRPVIEIPVNIFTANTFDQSSQSKGSRTRASFTTQTDDRGIYRAFGLPAGRYIVSIGRDQEAMNSIGFANRVSFKQVFYPEGDDPAKAEVIEVSEGGEVKNINLVAGADIKTFSARGRIVDADSGTPLPNIHFWLQRFRESTPEMISGMPNTSNNSGDFIIEGLAPGRYGAFLSNDTDNQLRVESGTFEILNENISGVLIKVNKGSSIAGTVAIESEDKAALAQLSQLQIQVLIQSPAQGRGPTMFSGQYGRANISADGTFHIGGLDSGLARIFVTSKYGDRAKGFIVSRIERDGVVQPVGIELKDGEHVTGVGVVLNYGASTIKGLVTVTNGALPPNGQIFVRIARAGDTQGIAGSRVDDRGRFVIDGLAAGVYEIYASVFIPNGQGSSIKQQVSLPGSGTTEVVLSIDLSVAPNRQP